MATRGFRTFFTVLGVMFFLGIGGLVVLVILVGRAPAVPEDAVLVLRVGGDLSEVAPADIVGYLRGARTPTVRTVVDSLRKAKVDTRIRAVLLKPTGFQSPFWGKVQEIRDAVLDFKKSGKPIHAYLEYGGEREYYLATAADRITLMPSSSLDLTGVATYELFLRGTLDRIGAVADLHHVGAYKTAPNMFTEKGYTATHKEMDESLTRDLYEQIVVGVAGGRRKTEADVRAHIDQGPLLPEAALRAGLVDDVQYEDQANARLSVSDERQRIDGDVYARVTAASLGLNRGPRIALIYAVGTINSGRNGYDPVNGTIAGADTLVSYIRQVRRDPSVRAIVLRIDSPGGSATASDAVWRELMIARNERADRPMVASMSDLAASGGYYIALPAQTIVAQPSTLTGSIGVFGGKIVTGGVYEKLGARIESTSIGKQAELDSPARPFTPAEVKKLDEQLQAFYDQFVKKVADSRHTTPARIDALAQGRVWTGRQAKDNGLIDALGGLDQAIALAKERAKIPAESDVEVVVYPPRKNFYELLTEELSGSGESAAVGAWLSANLSKEEIEVLRVVRGPLTMFRRGELLALMPFTFLR
ncbi:MAG: signal peptide peptidase SppA [Acidobacteria bacterium RIFCSPLOWO2_12_FULL_65_11]|nr:MAG: signal peptide peptidase SppA [Acidobacteria bacterium RIFCSPLOWO2_02_FULL_64_15]OFW30465.1 MAG: signal peptide peptidase SppA [Acidobacteria bacterium RIFCSPLOWO2_12_FULL_65_11]